MYPSRQYGTPGASNAVQRELNDIDVDIAESLNEIGMPITFNLRGEAGIRRDLYGSIKTWTSTTIIPPFTIGAYPYTHSPTQRQLEKAGMKEHCDLLVWFAYVEFSKRGIDPFGFDMERCTVWGDNIQWKIRERAHQNEYGNVEHYITLGLERM